MNAVSIQGAQAQLVDLIHKLMPGDELVITEDNRPVARLVGQAVQRPVLRKPGSAKGKLVIHAEDEDHLDDFKEYMP